MIHCDNLETLEYSQDTFLQQLLWRISQNYSLTKTMFSLKSIFLTVNKPTMLVNVVRSLPMMEELTIWSSLHHAEDLNGDDLSNLASLKLAGLEHSRYDEQTNSNYSIFPNISCILILQFPDRHGTCSWRQYYQAVSGKYPI